jgi:thiol-disulfide isomerase/thioredoxin
MKKILFLFLFISYTSFSQQIPFKLIGEFNDEPINRVDVRRNPTFSIDTIIIKNNIFTITGKLQYPRNIDVIINDYNTGYGVFVDEKPITVLYKNLPDMTSKKRSIEIFPIKISGNPISIDHNNVTQFFRKVKFTDTFNDKDKEEIISKIESHLTQFPNSYSNLLLISANIGILSDEKALKLMQKLPLNVQNEFLGPWIFKQIQLRNNIGKTTTNFVLPDSSGVNHFLVDTTKKYTLVMFWDSHCSPCRAQNRIMPNILKTIDLNKVSIVSVSLDEDKQDWLSAMKTDKVSWLQLNENKAFRSDIVRFFNFNAIPFDVLIDKNLIIKANGFSKSMEIINGK